MARASSGGSSARFWLALSVSWVPMRPWWRVTTRACRTAVAYCRQEASFMPKLKKELRDNNSDDHYCKSPAPQLSLSAHKTTLRSSHYP